MTVKKVFLIRHAETDYNREHRFQGTLQIPLNAKGQKQAEALASYLYKEPIEAIYTSHLSRAYQTADYIAQNRQLTVIRDERLAEIALGQFEGLRYDDMAKALPDEFRRFDSNDMTYCPPDGESRRSVQERMTQAWIDITENQPYQTVAIVAHGSASKILLRYMYYRLDDKRIENTAITTLVRYKDVWEIESFAETPHLND